MKTTKTILVPCRLLGGFLFLMVLLAVVFTTACGGAPAEAAPEPVAVVGKAPQPDAEVAMASEEEVEAKQTERAETREAAVEAVASPVVEAIVAENDKIQESNDTEVNFTFSESDDSEEVEAATDPEPAEQPESVEENTALWMDDTFEFPNGTPVFAEMTFECGGEVTILTIDAFNIAAGELTLPQCEGQRTLSWTPPNQESMVSRIFLSGTDAAGSVTVNQALLEHPVTIDGSSTAVVQYNPIPWEYWLKGGMFEFFCVNGSEFVPVGVLYFDGTHEFYAMTQEEIDAFGCAPTQIVSGPLTVTGEFFVVTHGQETPIGVKFTDFATPPAFRFVPNKAIAQSN